MLQLKFLFGLKIIFHDILVPLSQIIIFNRSEIKQDALKKINQSTHNKIKLMINIIVWVKSYFLVV